MSKWLPETIDYTKYQDFSNFIDDIYNIFTTDFFIKKIIFENKEVHVATKILKCKPNDNCQSIEYSCSNCPFKNKLDIFNHVITGKIETYRTPGKFNINRAKRVHWIKPIIEHYKNNVSYFNHSTKKGIDHYFWLKNEKFIVIVLETRNKRCYLKTAFYITDPTYENKFQTMFDEYVLKKSTIK